MTLATPGTTDSATERSVARYRRLLVLYPKAFREEFGDDLEQAYRDLLVFNADQKGLWARISTDLISSAAHERARSLKPGGAALATVLLATLAVLGAVLIAGTPGVIPGFLLLPAVVLVGLPVFGLTRFVRAWTIRRATGGSIVGQLALGVACLIPAASLLAVFGQEAGYFVFLAVSVSLILSASGGILWAGYRLLRPGPGQRRPWLRISLVLVPSVAVLSFIIGASLNSYINSLGPPGDHSVANASADTRALWQAAFDGDLIAVERLTIETCADPWVKFPIGNGRHNAKGMAETRGMTTDVNAPFGAIADTLGDYQNDWYDRCGRANE
ncbi:MAG: hypothetical protein ACR2N9_04770 [Acidimicrobiia bacterium]